MKYLLLVVSIVILSCNKDKSKAITSGNGQVAYYAQAVINGKTTIATNHQNVLSVPAISKVKWTSASIYVAEVVFEGKKDTKIITTKMVNSNLDLFSLKDSIAKINPPVGDYKEVSVMLRLQKSMDSKLAFLLNAIYTDIKGKNVPIRIGNSDEFRIKLAVSDVNINSAKDYKAVVKYDLDKVLFEISSDDLESAEKISDGTIVISSSINVGLYEKVKKNWQILASATFNEI